MRKICLFLFFAVAMCIAAMAQGVWQRGSHYFEYTGYEPLKDRLITVRYYIPTKGDIQTMRVLFVIPGAQRNSRYALENWKQFAERDGFVVIAPEYAREIWSINNYQFGGVFTDSTFTELNPREKWTYNTIEAIFDYFKEQTGNRSELYDINGHSAGGQFVHRMVLAMPNARIRLAVAANPSSWTYPFIDGIKDKNGNAYGWPYSVKGTPFACKDNIKRYLAAPLIIHLGDADTSTTVHDLDKAPGAQATGSNRFCRGNAFYEITKQFAKQLNTPYNWKHVVVEGIAHSGRGMIYGKSKNIDAEGNPVFCIDHITVTGAYNLVTGVYNVIFGRAPVR